MQDKRKILGKEGESAAALFLKKNGFTILETNFRTRSAEIDIIAKETGSNTICFIEVKTRKSFKKGAAKESVTAAKQKKIITGALFYLKLKKITNSRVRFDVVEVLKKNSDFIVNLIKNAFQSD